MQFTRLQTKIVVWAGICLLLTVASVIGYSTFTMHRNARTVRKEAIEQAQKHAKAVAREHANRIQTILEAPLKVARTLAQTLYGIKDDTISLKLSREEVNGMLRTILQQNPHFVGVYTLWEPDAFDGLDEIYAYDRGHDETGRFLPYWSRLGDGSIMVEPLVDYDQTGPGDYYQLPKQTKNECLIDPYTYPIQGENVLITSLVAPIVVNDVFYGIAGIDLRLDTLQELVEHVEDLYEGSAQITIISHNGTLAAVTGRPEWAGQHLKEHHHDWERDMSYVQKAEPDARIQQGQLEVFIPMVAGNTSTPWSVNIAIPESKITAAADAQLHRTMSDMWNMAGLGLLCLLLALMLLWLMARSITLPLRQAADFAQRLQAGDFNTSLALTQRDEIGVLARALEEMKNTIGNVLEETDHLTQAVQAGQLDMRGDPGTFSGAWRALITGLNSTIDAFMTPFNVTAEYLDRIAKGDIPEKIREDYQGDFIEVINNLNQCIDAIGGLVGETSRLTDAAVEGRLNVRGDASSFGGEYAEIVNGLNNVIATLVGHIDRIPIPIHIIDREFTIRYINRAGATLLTQSSEQILNRKCYDVFRTSDCRTKECACTRAMQSGKTETGNTEAHPDGQHLQLSHNSIPIADRSGSVIGALEILMDQTEIQEAMHSVQQQNWMRTGQAELSNLMRGDQKPVALSKKVIGYLAKYLDVQTGAIYLAERRHGETILQLSGSYAYTWRKGLNNAFHLGEGFVGQAALEQESIGYTDIPDEYLSIGSGLGATRPKYVLVTPFMYEGELKGVIEVGSTEKLNETQLEFLNQAAETIAVAFHSAQTRQKMQDLLEQTQRQAEEMQAQTEELQAQQEQLHSRKEKML